MSKTATSLLFLAMASFTLASCSPETSEPTVTIDEPVVDVQPVEVPASFTEVERLLAVGDRADAKEMTEELVETMGRQELSDSLDAYWSPQSQSRNEPAAVLLAEVMASNMDNAYSAAYIAGLAYDIGVSVQPDPARVIEFWDRPEVYGIPSAQLRLAEIYSDVDGDFYDADKAMAARARAESAN